MVLSGTKMCQSFGTNLPLLDSCKNCEKMIFYYANDSVTVNQIPKGTNIIALRHILGILFEHFEIPCGSGKS